MAISTIVQYACSEIKGNICYPIHLAGTDAKCLLPRDYDEIPIYFYSKNNEIILLQNYNDISSEEVNNNIAFQKHKIISCDETAIHDTRALKVLHNILKFYDNKRKLQAEGDLEKLVGDKVRSFIDLFHGVEKDLYNCLVVETLYTEVRPFYNMFSIFYLSVIDTNTISFDFLAKVNFFFIRNYSVSEISKYLKIDTIIINQIIKEYKSKICYICRETNGLAD